MQLDCSVFKSDESVHYNIEMLDAASCVVWTGGNGGEGGGERAAAGGPVGGRAQSDLRCAGLGNQRSFLGEVGVNQVKSAEALT